MSSLLSNYGFSHKTQKRRSLSFHSRDRSVKWVMQSNRSYQFYLPDALSCTCHTLHWYLWSNLSATGIEGTSLSEHLANVPRNVSFCVCTTLLECRQGKPAHAHRQPRSSDTLAYSKYRCDAHAHVLCHRLTQTSLVCSYLQGALSGWPRSTVDRAHRLYHEGSQRGEHLLQRCDEHPLLLEQSSDESNLWKGSSYLWSILRSHALVQWDTHFSKGFSAWACMSLTSSYDVSFCIL